MLDARIALLEGLRDELSGCTGCTYLSPKRCQPNNPRTPKTTSTGQHRRRHGETPAGGTGHRRRIGRPA